MSHYYCMPWELLKRNINVYIFNKSVHWGFKKVTAVWDWSSTSERLSDIVCWQIADHYRWTHTHTQLWIINHNHQIEKMFNKSHFKILNYITGRTPAHRMNRYLDLSHKVFYLYFSKHHIPYIVLTLSLR